MKKRKSKFPVFKNIKEEAEFWDTHSFSDYWDDTSEVKMVFELDTPRTESLIVRVQKGMKDKMKIIARKQGLNVSTLARMWMMEKLKTV